MHMLRDLSDTEIQRYESEGFVKLESILHPDWVDQLRSKIDSLHSSGVINSSQIDARVAHAEKTGANILIDRPEPPRGRFCVSTAQWRNDAELAALCLSGPLPRIASQLFGAPKINFLVDQMFVKEPGAAHRTAFHSDESYFNCTGEMCATFWIPVDVVDMANGAMGYIPGSHRWRRNFLPNDFISQEPLAEGRDGERIPDIEGNESLFGVVYVESRPGDIIVHHYRTLHGATGNTDPTRIRRAAALRYGGPDLRYLNRMNAGMFSELLNDGDVLDSADFPVVEVSHP